MVNILNGMMFYRRLRVNRESRNEESQRKGKCGIIATILVILVNEAFQKAASNGLLFNMIIYLMMDYHVTAAKAENIVSLWKIAIGIMAFAGACFTDSYVGRFRSIGIASVSSLLGMFLLCLTAMIPKLKPPYCPPSDQSCRSPTAAELTFLYISFFFISFGTSWVRCSIAFGADQIKRLKNSEYQRVFERFFLFYYAISSLTVIVAFTATAKMLDEYGWTVGFGVSTLPILIFVIIFFVCSPVYHKEEPKKGLFVGFIQVIVAAYKKRNLPFPNPNTREHYLPGEDSKVVVPSEKLRFLNKACLIANREQDVASDGSAVNPWRLCTLEQVEDLKVLIKVLPIWITGIMMWVNASQPTFKLLQARSMDRQVSQKLEIPQAAFAIYGVSTMLIWGILYDRVILPLASRIKGEPVQLSIKTRMGIGLLLSWLSMIVSAIIESLRQSKAIQEDNMSAMWLLPQYGLHGLAEGFVATAQMEFFYTELPKRMSSIAVTFFVLGMTVANWVSGFVLKAVSRRAGKGQISNDMNKAPLGDFYWVLVIMGFANLISFVIICSRGYGPSAEKYEENRAESDDG